MPSYRIKEAADLLGISDDTLRRWADTGRVATVERPGEARSIHGEELARLAESLRDPVELPSTAGASARNRFRGIVTEVIRDTVMAQVELQCGPHRVVSLMSREAADELGLQPGVVAVATIKSTNVGIELPAAER